MVSHFLKSSSFPPFDCHCVGRWFAHDPNVYSDPFKFRPERFLDDKSEMDPSQFVFGVGRRSCPGQLLAENTLFTAAVNLLAMVDLYRAKDASGQDIPIKVEYLGDTVT
jgi:cytochrome P450